MDIIRDTTSINQIECIYKQTEDIINSLDDYAIAELLSGNESDVDKILDILLNETKTALFGNSKTTIKSNTFDYLDKLTLSIDEEFRKRSFNYFNMSVLPTFDMGLHHIEWGILAQLYPKLAIIAARDHSKSYTFSFAYPLWRMYRYDPKIANSTKRNYLNKEGMIVTNEYSLAKDFLKRIKEEIENNPILREKLYPDGKSINWGNEELTCKNQAHLQIKGSGSALRGRHPFWMVIDDYLNESNLYSKDQRNAFINFFHSVFMNMIVPGGQVIVAGTPFHEKDLYGNLKDSEGWRVFEYPAINPDGTLLWPERHNLKSLLDKRSSQGNIIFSREILVKPISSDSSIFPWSILERSFVGMDNYTLADNIQSFPKKFKKIVMGCDFAISANVGADYSVFTTIGIDEYDNFWLLNQWKKKGASYNEQIAAMKNLYSKFRHNVIMAEDNAFQKVMIQIAKDAGLNVISHTTGVNKYDLKSGLPGLAVLFEQGKIKFPRGDAQAKNVTDSICSQAAGITWTDEGKLESTAEHDDELMSIWIALKAAHHVHNSFNYNFI